MKICCFDKGLSKEEINIAVQRSGVLEENTVSVPEIQSTVNPYGAPIPGPKVYQQCKLTGVLPLVLEEHSPIAFNKIVQ